MKEWVGRIGAVVVSALVAVLAHRRGRRADDLAERSGEATDGRAGVAQAFALLDETIANLRDDKRDLRADNRADRTRFAEDLAACRAQFAAYVRDHP